MAIQLLTLAAIVSNPEISDFSELLQDMSAISKSDMKRICLEPGGSCDTCYNSLTSLAQPRFEITFCLGGKSTSFDLLNLFEIILALQSSDGRTMVTDPILLGKLILSLRTTPNVGFDFNRFSATTLVAFLSTTAQIQVSDEIITRALHSAGFSYWDSNRIWCLVQIV